MDYVNLPDGIYTRAHVHFGVYVDGQDASALQSWLPLYDTSVVHVEVKGGAVRGVMQAELDAEAAKAVASVATAAPKPAPPVPTTESPVGEVDVSSYSFKQLKAALKLRGLNAFGKKAVLLERLQAASE
jgi:hypothetical protein